jgi:bifunctional DNA-binding transcriptional regulator/antitoxin component of YhaV-PrlF toxin-antitoxin module
MHIESSVGSKGELFMPKQLREALGFKPGDKIYFDIGEDNVLRVLKVPDLLELLKLPPINKPQSPNEIEQEIDASYEEQVRHSLEDEQH